LTRVRDVMTTNVPRVKTSATVLEATEAMNRVGSSGVAVFEGDDKIVGLITAKRLLTQFFVLNKKPEEVRVDQVMAPFYRISPDASTKEAARKILAHNITRLGVFEDAKFLGWISLRDLARELGKKRLIEVVRSNEEPDDPEFLCPNCKGAFMERIANDEGEILRWECPNCKYSL